MGKCRDLHLEKQGNWLASFSRRFVSSTLQWSMFALCATVIPALPLKSRLSYVPTCILLSNISLAWEPVNSLQCTSCARVTVAWCLVVGWFFPLEQRMQFSYWFVCSRGNTIPCHLLVWIFQICTVIADKFTDCEISCSCSESIGEGITSHSQHLLVSFLECSALQAVSLSLLLLTPFH